MNSSKPQKKAKHFGGLVQDCRYRDRTSVYSRYPCLYTGVTTLHRGTIPIATVLHSATDFKRIFERHFRMTNSLDRFWHTVELRSKFSPSNVFLDLRFIFSGSGTNLLALMGSLPRSNIPSSNIFIFHDITFEILGPLVLVNFDFAFSTHNFCASAINHEKNLHR